MAKERQSTQLVKKGPPDTEEDVFEKRNEI